MTFIQANQSQLLRQNRDIYSGKSLAVTEAEGGEESGEGEVISDVCDTCDFFSLFVCLCVDTVIKFIKWL